MEEIDGFAATKQTGDGGIDGRLCFSLPGHTSMQSIALDVKGGANAGIGTVRNLRGALERDTALMAGLIVMDDLGQRKPITSRRKWQLRAT